MTSIELDLSILDMRPYNGFKMRPMFPDNLNVVDAAQAAWDRAVSMDLKIAGGLAIVSVVGFLAIKLFKVNGNAESTPRNGLAYAPSLQQLFGGLGILSLGCAIGNAIDRIFPTVYSN